jgi:hypothetical protein
MSFLLFVFSFSFVSFSFFYYLFSVSPFTLFFLFFHPFFDRFRLPFLFIFFTTAFRSSLIHHKPYPPPFPQAASLNYSLLSVPQIRAEAAYLYDAVNLYAQAVLDLLDRKQDPRNGTAVISAIKGRNYRSAMG